MTQYVINIGALPNDGTGDPLRTAFNDVNLNFNQVFAAGPVLSNIQIVNNSILTTNTNGNLILAPNGTGKVTTAVDIVPNFDRVHSLGSSTNRWDSVYSQYVVVSKDINVAGNLSVSGNIIQVGNIITDALTIQLANTASTNLQANGAGITVGANDDIATILYDSGNSAWATNINLEVNGTITGTSISVSDATVYGNLNGLIGNFTGNVTADYFIGNGSQLTGITSYANADAVAYGEAGWAGNIIPSIANTYSLGNSTNQWSDLYVSNATIYMNNVPISLTASNVLTVDGQDVVTTSNTGVASIGNLLIQGTIISIAPGADSTGIDISPEGEGWAFLQLPTDATANLVDTRLHNDAGNIEFGTGNFSTGSTSYQWKFDNSGQINIPPQSVSFGTGRIQSANGYPTLLGYGSDDHGGPELDWMNTDDPNAFGNAEVLRNTMYLNDSGLYIGLNENGVGNAFIGHLTFDSTGNLSVPVNVNFNGGGIQQVVNEHFNITVSDDEDEGWSIYNTVDDGAGNVFTRTQIDNNGFYVRTDVAGSDYQWNFDNQGRLNLPGNISGIYGGNTSFYAYDNGSGGSVELKTISYAGDALGSNVRVTQSNATISTASAAYTWTFDNNGVLTLPGQAAQINTINSGWAFSETIIGIVYDTPAVITVASNVFPGPVSGQVTINGVNPPVQVNGTWYYQAVESNQFALYLDAALTQPVDPADWPGYVDGGTAVDLGNHNLVLSAGNIDFSTGQNGNEYAWSFDSTGNFNTPQGGHIGAAGVKGDGTMITGGRGNITSLTSYYSNVDALNYSTCVTANPDGTLNLTTYTDGNGVGGLWTFDSNGQVVFPTLTTDLHNGGNQSAQTLKFGDPNQQVVITGPAPAVDNNAQRLIIQGQRGSGNGEGGDVYIWGGDSDVNGGDIKIYAGDADGAGYGGYINLDAGSGTNGGGQLTLTSGTSSAGSAGPINITAGYSGGADGSAVNINGGQSVANAGPVNVTGGYGSAKGGDVVITGGGSGLGLPGYGNVRVAAGASSWTFDSTGVLTVPGEGVIQSINDNITLKTFNTTTGNANSVYLGTSGGLGFSDQEISGNWLEIFRSGADPEIRSMTANLLLTAASGTGGEGGKNVNITAGPADQSDYYTTAGGAVNIVGGLGGFNDGGGGGPGGDVNITAGISADPAGHAGNVNITSGLNNWVFDYNGNLTIPGDLVAATASPAPSIVGFGSINSATVSASGNVTGNYILGNVAFATGIPATYGNANLANIGANSISTTGNISASYLFGNASQLTGLPATYGNSNVATFLATYGSNTISTTGTVNAGNINSGNLLTGGLVSATGNVTGNYFIGNGSALTGVTVSVAGNIVGTSSNVQLVAGSYTTTFDNTGLATFPGNISTPNLIGFRVYGAGNTSPNATTTLTGNNWTVEYNQGNALNSTTGVFTAPIAGLYQVNLTARSRANNLPLSSVLVQKTSGNVTTQQCYIEFGENTTMNHAGSSTVSKLAVGDQLYVSVNAGNITFDLNDNWSVAFLG